MSKTGREYFRLDAESYSLLGRVGKKRRKYSRPLLDVFACGQVSSPRLYRLTSRSPIEIPPSHPFCWRKRCLNVLGLSRGSSQPENLMSGASDQSWNWGLLIFKSVGLTISVSLLLLRNTSCLWQVFKCRRNRSRENFNLICKRSSWNDQINQKLVCEEFYLDRKVYFICTFPGVFYCVKVLENIVQY